MPKAQSPAEGLTDTWGRRNRSIKDRACEACGRMYRPRRSSSRFCSRPCLWSQNGGQNRKDECWWTDSKGYVQGRVWQDGKPRRVKQHRHLVEQALGRYLDQSEDVHHRNGDKADNRMSNLVVIDHGAHSRHHNQQRTYRRGYTLNLSDSERQARSDRMRKRHALARAEGKS